VSRGKKGIVKEMKLRTRNSVAGGFFNSTLRIKALGIELIHNEKRRGGMKKRRITKSSSAGKNPGNLRSGGGVLQVSQKRKKDPRSKGRGGSQMEKLRPP